MIMSDLANYTQRLLDADKGQQIFFGFIAVGLIIKIGLSFAAAADALLWGYFIVIFSIFVVTIYSMFACPCFPYYIHIFYF